MKILGRITKRVGVLLIISFLLVTPVSLQACQENQESQHPCCCCGDLGEHHKTNATQEDDCGCQLNEKKQTGSQAVLFNSQQNTKPENTPFISEVEFNSKDLSWELRGIRSPHFSQFSKGPPLYILHSSFII